MLTRIFNWLTGDASVDGVSPALHRRALWIAFVITGVVYVMSFLLSLLLSFELPEPVQKFFFGFDEPGYGLIFWLPNVNNFNLWQVLLLPVLVYSLELKARGAKLPLAVLDLVACVLVGHMIERLLPVKYFHIEVVLFLVFALMFLRGHMARRLVIWVAALSLGVWCCLETLHIFTILGRIQLPTWPSLVPIESQVFSVLWLPLSIALPIILLARPRTPQLRPPASKAWQFTNVLLLTVLLAATSSALYYIGRSELIPSGLFWMATFTLLVALLWLYFTGLGSVEFLSFLTITAAGILVVLSLTSNAVYDLPWWATGGLVFAIASLLSLILATGRPLRRTSLWAALTVVAGSFAATVWEANIVSRFAERSRNLLWQVDPGVLVQLELSLLVELALFIGALLLAWWFVRPAEIEALLPWLAKLKPNRQAASP